MGIDKLRLLSYQCPRPEFFAEVNSDVAEQNEDKIFKIQFRNPMESSVCPGTFCSISTKKRVLPGFFLQLNYFAFKGMPMIHILEINPNKFSAGISDLQKLIEKIWGPHCSDFKISRIDLNADIQLPVDYFYRTLRVPLKRKTTRYANSEPEQIPSYSNRGVTGFYSGASPARLRVYDKREEMKRLRENVDSLPETITRLEWELRHRKCPISDLSELPEMLDKKPFENIEILDGNEFYDFHYNPVASLREFSFRKLAGEYGSQESARIMNCQRNFKRDIRPLLFDCTEIKERLQRSYMAGVEMFFANQSADSNLVRTLC